MRILLFTRHTPLPFEDGAGAYLFDLVEYLALQGHQVHLAWLHPHEALKWQGVWRPSKRFRKACWLHLPGAIRLGGFQFFPAVYWLPFKARALNRMKFLLARFGLKRRYLWPKASACSNDANGPCQAPSWMATPTVAEVAFAQRLILKLRPSVVGVNYPWLCPLLDLVSKEAERKFCVSVDVGWHRAALLAEQAGESEPQVTAAQEALWLSKADAVVAISEADVSEFKMLAPGRAYFVAPKAALSCSAPSVVETPSATCVFVGSDNSFNVEGLTWFLDEVWPIILRSRADTKLVVAGSIDRAISLRPAGVTFVGQTPNLEAIYHSASVVVVPLLRATGMNIKLVDAVAHGCCCVVTPPVFAGAPFFRECVISGESARAFAEATIHLLLNPGERRRLGDMGLRIIKERLSPERCYGGLERWIEEGDFSEPALT